MDPITRLLFYTITSIDKLEDAWAEWEKQLASALEDEATYTIAHANLRSNWTKLMEARRSLADLPDDFLKDTWGWPAFKAYANPRSEKEILLTFRKLSKKLDQERREGIRNPTAPLDFDLTQFLADDGTHEIPPEIPSDVETPEISLAIDAELAQDAHPYTAPSPKSRSAHEHQDLRQHLPDHRITDSGLTDINSFAEQQAIPKQPKVSIMDPETPRGEEALKKQTRLPSHPEPIGREAETKLPMAKFEVGGQYAVPCQQCAKVGHICNFVVGIGGRDTTARACERCKKRKQKCEYARKREIIPSEDADVEEPIKKRLRTREPQVKAEAYPNVPRLHNKKSKRATATTVKRGRSAHVKAKTIEERLSHLEINFTSCQLSHKNLSAEHNSLVDAVRELREELSSLKVMTRLRQTAR